MKDKLNNLEQAILAPRAKGRIKNIRKAWAEYKTFQRRSWWERVFAISGEKKDRRCL